MLWTDKDFVTGTDLATEEPEIFAVAATLGESGATVDGANSVCRRGLEDAASFLESRLSTYGSVYQSMGGLTGEHLYAIHTTGQASPSNKRRYSIEQVVVDGRSPNHWGELKVWAVNHVLAYFFMMANNKMSDDRYENKMKFYRQREEQQLWPNLTSLGLPIVVQPLARPGALWSEDPGSWAVTQSASAGQAGGDWAVTVTYYASAGQEGFRESAPSEALTIETGEDFALEVDIEDLVAPNGVQTLSQRARGCFTPLAATHWNIYAGFEGGPRYLRNASPIPIATRTYTVLEADPTVLVREPMGQPIQSYAVFQNIAQRG